MAGRSKQMTEMLKGTLEGIVLAILEKRPAYGYEITASLRDGGFDDIAEGTVYAPVSYTHLDVYKRQLLHQGPRPRPRCQARSRVLFRR